MEGVDLSNKTAIVTGANSGIGKYTAQCLAQKGARVILACRNEERGLLAVNDIKEKTGNTNVYFRKLDLSSFASVRQFCQDYNQSKDRLDILINNAGLLKNERAVSADGHELTLAVNFLGPFLLTHLLLDKLKSCAPSRIVNVTSEIYEHHVFTFDDVELEEKYDMLGAYGRSKTALVMFTVYLAGLLKGSGVTVNSLHPGVIQTDLMREVPAFNSAIFRFLFPYLMRLFKGQRVVSVEEGSETTLYCALEPSLADHSGKHFFECEERQIKPYALDSADNERLWRLACELCDITQPTNSP